MDGVVLHQGDSTKLEPPTAVGNWSAATIRFFTVDGGHTEEIVFSDMQLAEATLAEGGIVIADDVFNQQWPGVAVGHSEVPRRRRQARARSLIGFNKVFFTQPEFCDVLPRPARFRRAAASCASSRATVFAGHDVALFVPQ